MHTDPRSGVCRTSAPGPARSGLCAISVLLPLAWLCLAARVRRLLMSAGAAPTASRCDLAASNSGYGSAIRAATMAEAISSSVGPSSPAKARVLRETLRAERADGPVEAAA